MSLGSFLTSAVGTLVGYVAPQTGPAVAATLSTVTSGHIGDLGQATSAVVDALGHDTTQSTILHGVANAVTAVGNIPGVSAVVTPLLEPALHGVLSEVGSAIETPLTLLVPHIAPAASALLGAIGSGNIADIGQATGTLVNATGAEIAQSTVLHGVANAVTALTDSLSFNFGTSSAGSDSLHGILGQAVGQTQAIGGSSASPAVEALASHVDLPLDHSLDAISHALHHA
jgi:hypothetical protein